MESCVDSALRQTCNRQPSGWGSFYLRSGLICHPCAAHTMADLSIISRHGTPWRTQQASQILITYIFSLLVAISTFRKDTFKSFTTCGNKNPIFDGLKSASLYHTRLVLMKVASIRLPPDEAARWRPEITRLQPTCIHHNLLQVQLVAQRTEAYDMRSRKVTCQCEIVLSGPYSVHHGIGPALGQIASPGTIQQRHARALGVIKCNIILDRRVGADLEDSGEVQGHGHSLGLREQRRVEVCSAGLDRDGACGFDERFLAIRSPAAVYRQVDLLKVSGDRPYADGDHALEVVGRGIPVDRDFDPRILLVVGQ
ncbi:hypothetical protein BN1708_003277 [Verticillium longisporum]|uniref:Uncharacterized protein n=1 Tax=Verticillium longisporum TaxID=100787 RepID=A0A0G4LE78_VERLO|nr:hypothetical protein BN1708_003277 [Verticillium longisporum]